MTASEPDLNRLHETEQAVLEHLSRFEEDPAPYRRDLERLADWSLAQAQYDEAFAQEEVTHVESFFKRVIKTDPDSGEPIIDSESGEPELEFPNMPTSRPPRQTPEEQVSSSRYRLCKAQREIRYLWTLHAVDVPGCIEDYGNEGFPSSMVKDAFTRATEENRWEPILQLHAYRARCLREAVEEQRSRAGLDAPQPPADWKPNFRVDLKKPAAVYNGRPYEVTPKQALLLARLWKAWPGRLTSEELKEYPNSKEKPREVLNGLHPTLRRLIQRKPGSGGGTRLLFPEEQLGVELGVE